MKVGLLVVAGLALLAGPATPTAMSDIRSPKHVPLPPEFPSVVFGPCPSFPRNEGCADHERGILYARSRETYWHELGHFYDWQVLSERQRARFRALTRAPRQLPWWNYSSDPDVESVAENFADAYAICALNYRPPGFWPGYMPNRKLHSRVCEFIRSTA
jgi:hypothetical protein